MPYTYPKSEKLKQKKQIAFLFEKGKWKSHGNVRVITVNYEGLSTPKTGVSVSKRYFKRAVDRNRIKRLLREAYRLNKDTFTTRFGANSLSMIFWISKGLPKGYQEVEEQFLQLCESKK